MFKSVIPFKKYLSKELYHILEKHNRLIKKKRGMKLHIGCGDIIIPGWTNLDIDNLPGVDINDDARMLSKIPDESCDIIYACHILEHLGRHEIENVLKTWNKKHWFKVTLVF